MSSNVDIYHEMIVDYSRHPSNFGKIENPTIQYHDSNPLCGDSIEIFMNVENDKVSDIKFNGRGCAICMACTSVLTEIVKGKSIEDVRKIQKNDVLGELGLETPPSSQNKMRPIVTQGPKIRTVLISGKQGCKCRRIKTGSLLTILGVFVSEISLAIRKTIFEKFNNANERFTNDEFFAELQKSGKIDQH